MKKKNDICFVILYHNTKDQSFLAYFFNGLLSAYLANLDGFI